MRLHPISTTTISISQSSTMTSVPSRCRTLRRCYTSRCSTAQVSSSTSLPREHKRPTPRCKSNSHNTSICCLDSQACGHTSSVNEAELVCVDLVKSRLRPTAVSSSRKSLYSSKNSRDGISRRPSSARTEANSRVWLSWGTPMWASLPS